MRYFEELCKAMQMLAEHPQSIFIGQSVAYPGTAMTNTLAQVDRSKLIELPVAEEMQMGMSIGLSLAGWLPISFYPRWNFLLLAVNQLVNHLDKLPLQGYSPKVIIRTGIGSIRPLHPQHQHVGDYTEAFRLMCPRVNVWRLEEAENVVPAYRRALDSGQSSIIVEYGDYHNEK